MNKEKDLILGPILDIERKSIFLIFLSTFRLFFPYYKQYIMKTKEDEWEGFE